MVCDAERSTVKGWQSRGSPSAGAVELANESSVELASESFRESTAGHLRREPAVASVVRSQVTVPSVFDRSLASHVFPPIRRTLHACRRRSRHPQNQAIFVPVGLRRCRRPTEYRTRTRFSRLFRAFDCKSQRTWHPKVPAKRRVENATKNRYRARRILSCS